MVLLSGSWSVFPQDQRVTKLSESVYTARYPEIICAHCIVPEWDRGYLFHHEIEKNTDRDNAMVTMYDREGKKVLSGKIWDAQVVNVTVTTAGAARGGGILAGAVGIMTDGSIQGFLARTDATGRTVQSVHTGQFIPRKVCEADDGTVWALSRDRYAEPQQRDDVLRHYSFEKGQLGSYLGLDSLARNGDEVIAILWKSYLGCAKNRAVVYFGTGEYAEVDSNGKVSRWKVENAGALGNPRSGFAVTDDGRVFVGHQNAESESGRFSRGLYELVARTGSAAATLRPIEGTVTSMVAGTAAPDGQFAQLWGADGNELVISATGDQALRWVNMETVGAAEMASH